MISNDSSAYYYVYYTDDNGMTYKYIATQTNATEVNITGISGNSNYAFYVVAYSNEPFVLPSEPSDSFYLCSSSYNISNITLNVCDEQMVTTIIHSSATLPEVNNPFSTSMINYYSTNDLSSVCHCSSNYAMSVIQIQSYSILYSHYPSPSIAPVVQSPIYIASVSTLLVTNLITVTVLIVSYVCLLKKRHSKE